MAMVCFKLCGCCKEDCKNLYANIKKEKAEAGKEDWSSLSFQKSKQEQK
jgi:hypothetical protein